VRRGGKGGEGKGREKERRDEKRKEGEGDERGGIVVCFYLFCVIYLSPFLFLLCRNSFHRSFLQFHLVALWVMARVKMAK
jgi:hypothetical protein